MADDLEGRLQGIARNLSYLRAGVGATTLLAPRIAGIIMGFPKDEMSASALTIARFFGVREMVLAAATLRASADQPRNQQLYELNALVDGGDAAVVLATMLRRGPSRALLGSLAIAAPVCATWLWIRQQSQSAAPASA